MTKPHADTRIETGPAGLVKSTMLRESMDQPQTLFSNSSTMIPGHARLPVTQAPAQSKDVVTQGVS
jgi:hypothetical protein